MILSGHGLKSTQKKFWRPEALVQLRVKLFGRLMAVDFWVVKKASILSRVGRVEVNFCASESRPSQTEIRASRLRLGHSRTAIPQEQVMQPLLSNRCALTLWINNGKIRRSCPRINSPMPKGRRISGVWCWTTTADPILGLHQHPLKGFRFLDMLRDHRSHRTFNPPQWIPRLSIKSGCWLKGLKEGSMIGRWPPHSAKR